MGFQIGTPTLKLARIKASNAGEHTGTLRAVLAEGWEQIDKAGKPYRCCKDEDYDVSRTAGNMYEGIRNAIELAQTIEDTADEYSRKRKASGGKAIRKTAGIGFNVILKPPAEVINAMDEADQERFRRDLWESWLVISKRFIAEGCSHGAWHTDEEGGHWHIAGPAITPKGKLDADAILGPKLYTALNKALPAEMRRRGWPEVEDSAIYDAEAAKNMTQEEKADYKTKCRAKRRKSVDSKTYKAQKEIERLQALVDELQKPVKAPESVQDTADASKLSVHEDTPTKPSEAVQEPQRGLPKINKDFERAEWKIGGDTGSPYKYDFTFAFDE